MKENLQTTKVLLDMKNVIEFYNKLATKAAEEAGITRPEGDILIFLRNNPEHNSAKDIVKLKGVSKAYVSKAVEPLLQKGLIEIEVDATDRRCQHLTLTEKAAPIVDIFHEMQKDFINKLTSGIDPEELNIHWKVTTQFSQNALKY